MKVMIVLVLTLLVSSACKAPKMIMNQSEIAETPTIIPRVASTQATSNIGTASSERTSTTTLSAEKTAPSFSETAS